jgi:hypothetical protein
VLLETRSPVLFSHDRFEPSAASKNIRQASVVMV